MVHQKISGFIWTGLLVAILLGTGNPGEAIASSSTRQVKPLKIGPIHRGFIKHSKSPSLADDEGGSGSLDVDEDDDGGIVSIESYDGDDDDDEVDHEFLEMHDDSSDVSYAFRIMGQGKIHKPSKCCFGSQEDPGCYGVARIGDKIIPFEMPAADLRVGRTVFEGLTPGTDYEVQVGYLPGDILDDIDAVDLDWSQIDPFTIMTPPAKPGQFASFVYGSCARIGKIGPITLWQRKVRAILDAMQTNIATHEKSGIKTDAILTLGDFPYMDATGELTAAKTRNEMLKRVDLLYATEEAKRLLSKAPVHQMRDDHEWWNNSTAEIPAGRAARSDAARQIYDLFQRPDGAATETNYQIIEGNFEAFMCDTRSERYPSSKQFMSADQMAALKTWISDPARKDRIKPVFFSGPVLMLQEDDTFWEYPAQLLEFMSWIKEQDIKYLFFGTGDIHVGKTGLWQFEDDGPFILEDASSALHKINHNKDALLKDTFTLGEDEDKVSLRAVGGLSPTVTDDHYTRVILDHETHTVEIIKRNRHNHLLMDVVYNLEDGSYANREFEEGITPKYSVTPILGGDKLEEDF